ncbi:MAG: hypothetical protein CVU59_13080, partial [Deltaproteobacteria bacterium HGW-Deltaproteobacteria-17]
SKRIINEIQAALALTPQSELTAAQIAQRVADTLRTTMKLRLERESVQDHPPAAVRYWQIMAPGRFKTVAFKGDGAFLGAYASNDGQIVEVRPDWKKADDGSVVRDFKRYFYAAQGPDGEAVSPNSYPLDCNWGGGTASLVGPASEYASFLQQRLAEGVREPDQSMEGMDCFVIYWNPNLEGGFQTHERHYIEKATFRQVLREQQQSYEDGVVINRTSRYRYWTEGIPDPPWIITDDELVDRSRRTVGAPDPPMAVPPLDGEEAPAAPESQPPKSSAVLDYLDSKAISGTKMPD